MANKLVINSDNIVENIIVVDEGFILEGKLLIEATGQASAGDSYDPDTGLFTEKPERVKTASEINATISAQLAANDLKIIRALVDGDTARVAAHKAAQSALRAQMV